MKIGAIDLMMEHWGRERPDLDSSSLGVLARVSRLARAAEENAAVLLQRFNLSEVEFLLLAAIRTAPDQRPAPRDLLDTLMVTSGGLTNRIDRLEAAGLVGRTANPEDRRGIRLQLTDAGRQLVDQVTTAYVENQNDVLDAALREDERDTLARLLRKLLASLSVDDRPPIGDTRETRPRPGRPARPRHGQVSGGTATTADQPGAALAPPPPSR